MTSVESWPDPRIAKLTDDLAAAHSQVQKLMAERDGFEALLNRCRSVHSAVCDALDSAEVSQNETTSHRVDLLRAQRDSALAELERARGLGTRDQGIRDCIDIIIGRQRHYECYREPGAMQTRPATFAILEEVMVFLQAHRERAQQVAIEAARSAGVVSGERDALSDHNRKSWPYEAAHHDEHHNREDAMRAVMEAAVKLYDENQIEAGMGGGLAPRHYRTFVALKRLYSAIDAARAAGVVK